MKSSVPDVLAPPWNELVLVCRDCRKRSRGPTLKAKALVSELKLHYRAMRPRPRVVMSTCMGLCPRQATAVALAHDGAAIEVVAIASLEQIAALK